MVRPNMEVMCIVKSLKFEAVYVYSISVLLALLYDHCLVSLLFLDVIGTVAGTAIPTSRFILRPYIVFRNYVNVWLPVRNLVYISVKKWRTFGWLIVF